MAEPIQPQLPPVAPTGIAGLDAILHGGLPRDEMHMVQGVAGTGKTTISLQFLRAAAAAGEPSIYLTLSQSKANLERIARSHGWSLDGITVHELSPGTVADRLAARQTVLPTIEVELDELFHDVQELVRAVQPKRAVVDSLTMLQLLAGSPQHYHREVVTLRQLFVDQGCTVVVLADHPGGGDMGQAAEVIFHPLCGVVIDLTQRDRAYGDVRRLLRVIKARGLPHNGGLYDVKIATGGLSVFPRLGAYVEPEHTDFARLSSGVAELDAVLAGGLERGTACLLVGPSGTGKSTLATVFVAAAAGRGEPAAVYLFDERPETYRARAAGLGIPLGPGVDAGTVLLRQLDPAEIGPGEFAHAVNQDLDRHAARVVVIDSVAGYFNAVGSAELFVAQLHELLTYLSRRGVLTILCASQEGFMSIGEQPGVDISYLSDTIVALAYYEDDGAVRRCLTVVKRRAGEHDTTIRQLRIGPDGVHLGPPLRGYRHLLLANGQPGPADREADAG